MGTDNPKPKNPSAVALGKLAKGRPKKYSNEEMAKRIERIKLNRYTPKKVKKIL